MCVCILLILFISSIIVSKGKLSTTNPFVAAKGLFQIIYTQKEYIEIQKSPKVIIAKSDSTSYDKFIQFMDTRGYTLLEDEQEGAMNTFKNKETDDKEHVIFSVNKYYALWVWKN